MDKQTTNQVRQILMNELGLTRKSVREEMQKIVDDTIKQTLKRWEAEDVIERAVRYEVSLLMPRYRNNPSALRDEVKNLSLGILKEQLAAQIQVTLTPPAE